MWQLTWEAVPNSEPQAQAQAQVQVQVQVQTEQQALELVPRELELVRRAVPTSVQGAQHV